MIYLCYYINLYEINNLKKIKFLIIKKRLLFGFESRFVDMEVMVIVLLIFFGGDF